MALLWDDRLIGWLVFMRLQGTEVPVSMPAIVRVAMTKKGWIISEDDPLVDDGETFEYSLTDEGAKIADLYAGDWGVDGLGFMEEHTIE
jgi:hypothetical protein